MPFTLNVIHHLDGKSGVLENAVLIAGDREAMLVDAHVIRPAAQKLAALIKKGGWRLKQIYISHPHPDHFGGLQVLRDEFRHTPILAAPEVAATIAAQGAFMLDLVKQKYGPLACEELVVPESCQDSSLRIDREEVQLLQYAGGEASHQTAFYIPRARTLVAGDLVYNRVHLFLTGKQPGMWLRHLEEIPTGRSIRSVFGGHGEFPVDTSIFDELRTYICFFIAAVESSKTAQEAIGRIAREYPHYRSADYLLVHSVGAYFGGGAGASQTSGETAAPGKAPAPGKGTAPTGSRPRR